MSLLLAAPSTSTWWLGQASGMRNPEAAMIASTRRGGRLTLSSVRLRLDPSHPLIVPSLGLIIDYPPRHTVVPSTWTALDKVEQETAIAKLNNQYLPVLSKLAGPNAGCYINEDNPYEGNLSGVFWGANYPRLLSTKRVVDPDNVFWCTACVGRERWVEDGTGGLCQASSTNSSSAGAPTKTSGTSRTFGGFIGMRLLRMRLGGLRIGRGVQV